MRSKKVMLTGMYITIFIVSFGFIMYSALVASFAVTYEITLAEAGIVGSVLCAGQLVVIFLNDYLGRKLTKLVLIVAGTTLHVLSMFWIALSPSFVILIAAFFVNGAAISLLNVVMSAHISDLFQDKRNSYLNIFHGIYGLGSLAGPILPTLIIACGLNWQVSYIIIGMLSILVLIFMAVLAKAQTNQEISQKRENIEGKRTFITLLRNQATVLICICSLLFMGFDMTVSTYMSSYMELELNAAAIAGLTITFYWTGSAVGRLLYPVLFAGFDTRKYLVAVNLLTAVLLFVGTGVSGKYVMLVMIAVIGLLSGVNFPLQIGMACELTPENSVGATNAVSIFGSAGGILFPMLAGTLMELYGNPALLIQSGCMLAAIIICLLVLIKIKKE